MPPKFTTRTDLPTDAQRAFAWHCEPGALERLIPPWEDVRVEGAAKPLTQGHTVVLRPKVGPLRLRWVADIEGFDPEQTRFQDVQRSGPFSRWVHIHSLLAKDGSGCTLEDSVHYRLPLGPLGSLGNFIVRKRLEDMFRWRHEVTRRDLARHATYSGRPLMKILVTGSTGMVGSSLVPFLTTGGHKVLRLVRREPQGPDEVQWSVDGGVKNPEQLEGLDGVVHLAGENIAAGRWSDAQKKRIRDSRVDGTRVLVEALGKLKQPPKAFVCASAIGYYGNRGDEQLTEASSAGSGFLSEVVQAWEAEAAKASACGARVVQARFGIILSPKGGALKKMLLPFKLGGGGRLGSGNQWMSWVALDDVVGALYHALTTDSVQGPINVVAPEPVTNRTYTKVLGRVLSRPTIIPVPGFGVKLAFGEMGEELLLGSQRVLPKALETSGFRFDYPDLEQALRHLLGRRAAQVSEVVHA